MDMNGWLTRLAEDPATVAWAEAFAQQLDSELYPGDALTQVAGMRLVSAGLATWGGVLFGYREYQKEYDDPMTPAEWLDRELRIRTPAMGMRSCRSGRRSRRRGRPCRRSLVKTSWRR